MRTDREDILRSQKTMVFVRWVAVPWALMQVVVYELPYPEGLKAAAFALVALLVCGNAALHVATHRLDDPSKARSIALIGLALDAAVLLGFVWVFSFDPASALWAILFILPLEGAISFQLRGALGAWAFATAMYILRELWGSDRFDYPLEWNSITFRMGIAAVISLVAGLMARDLVRQREQLREALTELQRIDRLRAGLVSTLGHDVRSPLTVIRGGIATLLRHGSAVDETRARAMLESADKQARRLEGLANDLLDLARLEEGRLDLRIDDVHVRNAVEDTLQYVERGDDVVITVDPTLRVRVDPRRLEQIIYNVVTNALRHGGPPYVVAADSENGTVTLHFEDRGRGVSEEEIAYLFEPFRSEDVTGSIGYGLAIVKALAEAHGGRVSYKSLDPHGACFSVALPAAAPDASLAASAGPRTVDLRD